MRKRSSLIVAAALALCLGLGGAEPQTKPTTAPALLTKEQLLQRVTELRSRVKDLSVVTEDIVTKGPPNTVRRSHKTIVMKRDMMYIDELYGSELPTFRVQRSFDGKQTTIDGRPAGDAMISKGRSREMDTQTMGFFTVNLLNPPGQGTNRSLLGSLQKVPCTIRKEIEIIDGHSCEVVEFAEPRNDKLIAWLDLDRGLLPVRHRQFRHDGTLWFECNVEKAIEVEKDLWFATRAKTTVFDVFKDLEGAGGVEQVIIVDSFPNGPLLQVNTDPDDSIFDLASRLPIGTKLHNLDNMREMRVVGFTKNQQPATKPAAAAEPANHPLLAAQNFAVERKVEFDLKPWSEAVQGVSLRFRLGKDNGSGSPYLDIKNSNQQHMRYDFGRPRLEFDQKWYFRENEKEYFSDLSAGRTYQGIGPIFLGAKWITEQGRQPLVKAPGKHTIRVKFTAKPADGKGEAFEVVSAPLEIVWPGN
jgi:hypothetical protein